MKGDTGTSLLYLYARLCSLEENCGVQLNPNAITGTLVEDEAQKLVNAIAQTPLAVEDAVESLEAHEIVEHLFYIRGCANRAMRVCRIRGETTEVAEARLSMFIACRIVVKSLMQTLGMKVMSRV